MAGPDVTSLLGDLRGGDERAFESLLPLVYDQLHALASRHLRRERADHTLQPTALVHEAYLKLVRERERNYENRRHFLCIAATAMRRVLVNHADRHRSKKRGGDRERVPLDAAVALFEESAIDLVALDDALERLERIDADKARIVELRFFAGLTAEETAETLGISSRTVERGWQMARAWLRVEVGRDAD